ncbi:hypothetical protein GN956_G10031 [Arapaima gigas]
MRQDPNPAELVLNKQLEPLLGPEATASPEWHRTGGEISPHPRPTSPPQCLQVPPPQFFFSTSAQGITAKRLDLTPLLPTPRRARAALYVAGRAAELCETAEVNGTRVPNATWCRADYTLSLQSGWNGLNGRGSVLMCTAEDGALECV